MDMVSLKQPCNQIKRVSRVPNTPNTMVNCIGALVRRRDGDKSVMWMIEIYFYNNPQSAMKNHSKVIF